jgi:hypothetical protein
LPFFISAGAFLTIMLKGSNKLIKCFEKRGELDMTKETVAWIVIFLTLVPFAVIASVLAGVILLLPGYVFHVYAFVKSKQWWKSQNKEHMHSSPDDKEIDYD